MRPKGLYGYLDHGIVSDWLVLVRRYGDGQDQPPSREDGMVRFQQGQMDSSGTYRGTSYGCGVASLLFFLGTIATAIVIGWPFLVIHGPVAWLVEIPYVIIAGVVGLGLLAKRAGNGRHEEKP